MATRREIIPTIIMTTRGVGGSGATVEGGTPTSRTLTAGAGLTGGGDLTTDRTFAVGAGTGITVNADDIQVNRTVVDTWYSDAAHNHDSTYVNVGGDTMTSFLTLNADPTSNLHAATKQYADLMPAGAMRPSDNNLIAWTHDIAMTNTSSALTSGTIYLSKVRVTAATTITNILFYIGTGGSTLTASQNFVGLYSSSGTRLGLSADQSSSWTSTGTKTVALTTPYSAAADYYYIAMLSNGTTPPAVSRGTATPLVNAGLGSGAYRWATGGTGQTTLPSSITMSGIVAASNTWWFGLS